MRVPPSFCTLRTGSHITNQTSQYARGSNVVASCIFLLELGSSLGGVVAGTLSDKMFAGRRGPVIALFSVATALPSLFLLASMPGVLRDWNSDCE